MLYQKRRPQTFNEVQGQDLTIKEIKNFFIENSFPNVVLISGNSGTGKSTIGNIIAKTINCKNKTNAYTPCNTCDSCLDIIKESYSLCAHALDATTINIQDMREIDDIISITEFAVDNTIIILEEFQELQSKQQKVILKTLERFKKDVYFILLSMDESKIDFSIKGGRTVHWKLKSLKSDLIAEELANVCSKENVLIDTEEKANILFTIADSCNGSLRDAISKLEKVIINKSWNEKELEESLEIKNSKSINQLCIKLIDRDPTIFEEEITKEILDSIKKNLSLLLQSILGVKLGTWQKNNLTNLIGYKKATKENVLDILECLDMTFKYPFINREIINTILFRLFVKQESQKVILKEEVKPNIVNVPQQEIKSEPVRRRREE